MTFHRRGLLHAATHVVVVGRGRVRAGRGPRAAAEGIELAKKRGVNKGRRPSLTADRVTELRAQATAGVPKTRLPRQHGIHRDTVYRGRR